ncbi:ABC transporter permease [Pseudonocardia sp. KRD291]|uniref:ABC transporter permease n=1 Tax=Pseudonocardia sp. KRD291 TaxID=2792007 RepID=UPI001C4A4234|nr:ABC transporter permease [Pseudonocardia sp. KRD291]MBW0104369.1 ABC transporter permease [Pseudonocardia sp. KRD291]
MTLLAAHYRFQVLEQARIPIALVSSAAFPALSLLFFVVPFDFASSPDAATTAVVQLIVFAVMISFLFTFGVGVADDREKSWDPYLRTLPAPAWPRIAGRVLTGATFALLSIIPVVIVGALFTEATASPVQLLLGMLALVVAGLPFLFGGLAIGYSLPVKVALPVTNLIFFPISFAGGLLIPPTLFPSWLQTFSALLPSRGARDLVVLAVVGTPPDVVAIVVLAGWIAVTGALTVWAYRRDEGRRFR